MFTYNEIKSKIAVIKPMPPLTNLRATASATFPPNFTAATPRAS